MMVRFRDLNDPKSVERVDPDAICVRRITAETTSDDVTTGIEKRLGWLRDAENFHYSGRAYGETYSVPSDALRSAMK